MTHRILIAGTGTEVGKTHLTALLAPAFRRRGIRVLALKPVESGFVAENDSDAMRLAHAAGHSFIAPCYRFVPPVSPHRAAREAGHDIELAKVRRWIEQHERSHQPQITLVETAGGLFTPLTESVQNAAMLSTLDIGRWVLVARNRLGVLHDVIVTLTAIRSMFRSPDAVIVNDGISSDPDPENARDLSRLIEPQVHALRTSSSLEALVDLLLRP